MEVNWGGRGGPGLEGVGLALGEAGDGGVRVTQVLDGGAEGRGQAPPEREGEWVGGIDGKPEQSQIEKAWEFQNSGRLLTVLERENTDI